MGIKKLSIGKNITRHTEFISVSNLFALVGKILKQVQDHMFVLIFLLALFIVCCLPLTVNAQESNPLVRIAINNNNFKSITYNEISIIATNNYTVYDKTSAKPIIKLSPSDILKIKINSDKFDLIVNNKTERKNLRGVLVIDCPNGLLGVENLKRNSKQALYHGIFEITPKDETSFYLINVLDLQNYLKGVVPNEMPVGFGLEALKAQAIAAKNYVLMPRVKKHKQFDVDDSVSSQVYFGANTEKELSNEAVEKTQGLVALDGWDVILAQYSSTAGGYTENYENTFSDPKTKDFPPKTKPYLKGRPDIYGVGALNREEEARLFYMSYPDSYDMKSPYYRWQKEFKREELEKVLSKTLISQSKTGFVKPEFKQGDTLGELKELKVKQRGVSGKIVELEIITDKKTYSVFKELVIRRTLQKDGVSLPSANVVFENLYDSDKKLNKIVAYGAGFGHGVGMSQYGAGFMATTLNKSFDKILKRYYTGITVSTIPVILSSDKTQQTITQNFYAIEKKAVLVIDNKYQLKDFNANINGNNINFELEKNLLPTSRINRIDISDYIKQGKNIITFYFPEKNKNKALRLYVELVEKDDNEYNF
jgi:stage II sporulation protein D